MYPVLNRVACLMSAAAACALLALASVPAHAATVLGVGTADLASQSDFIFHGKVVEKWAAAGPGNGTIVTYLRFSVSDVLKGASGRESVVLGFLGGSLNGRTMRIEGMKIPAIGEEGVFFVERLARLQVHPLFGWDQGRFLVRSDAQGRKTVYTHDLLPVRQLNAESTMSAISGGHAAGVIVATSVREAMPLETFKQSVRAMVEAQQ